MQVVTMNQAKDKNRIVGIAVTIAAFTLFFLSVCYKLTQASLWYDEAVEYWYSKYMTGPLPIPTLNTIGTTSMYERIITTFQPPLYNFLMFFWLKISESMWWFRFFGVVMAMIGAAGIWNVVRFLTSSVNAYRLCLDSSTDMGRSSDFNAMNQFGGVLLADLSVALLGMVYQMTYFWQECSEYCVMLAALPWAVYFWLCLMETPSPRYIWGFVIASVAAIYGQYGAGFPVILMIVWSFFVVLRRKEKHLNIHLLLSYASAFLFAAVPLLWFFILPQVNRQRGEVSEIWSLTFDGNILKDILVQLRIVIRWNFFSWADMWVTNIMMVLILVLVAGAFFLGKNRTTKRLLILNGIILVLYYILVKLGYYGLGGYGNRYNLFMVPLWLVTFYAVMLEWYEMIPRLITWLRNRFEKNSDEITVQTDINEEKSDVAGKMDNSRFDDVMRRCLPTFLLIFVIIYSLCAWNLGLKDNFVKEDHRGLVEAWYENQGYELPTYVYYGAVPGFAYYLKQNKGYSDQTQEKLVYQEYLRRGSVEEYQQQLVDIYGEEWPEDMYLGASHTLSDWDKLVEVFERSGYEMETIFIGSDAYLLRLTK